MKCKECKKIFEEEYVGKLYCNSCLDKRMKSGSSKSSTLRMLRNREFVRSIKKDKKCEICGYNKYPEILVFHHKDKRNKFGGVSYLMKTLRHPDIIEAEIEKCILICPNCHHELHFLEYKNKQSDNLR